MQMSPDCPRPHSGLNSEAEEVNKNSLMTQEIEEVHSIQVYLQQSQANKRQKKRHAKWQLSVHDLIFIRLGSLA